MKSPPLIDINGRTPVPPPVGEDDNETCAREGHWCWAGQCQRCNGPC